VSDSPCDPQFELFFRANFRRTVAVARRVTGDVASAEDAAIEAMAKAHARWPRLSEDPRVASWVLKVATNEAIRRLPRREVPAVAERVEDFTDGSALRLTVAQAIRTLPTRQREVIAMRFLAGMSEPEVATALGLSLGTVKTHIRRGLHRLRGVLGPEMKEDRHAQYA
jgi:RNA polymerase sigma factor (sigma-70 family)